MTNTESNRPLRIFLCHSSGDKPAVRELYRRLKAAGFAPWLDEEDLLPGMDWQAEIPKTVRNSDEVIVCLSRGSINKAGYIQKEIKFALDVADEQPEGTIFLIPVKLEECDVPERLARWQWVNLYDEDGYRRLICSLQNRSDSLDLGKVPHSFASSREPGNNVPITGVWVDIDAGEVWIDSEQVPFLSDLEYRLFLLLYGRQGKICDKYQIVKAVWGQDYITEVDNVRIEKLISRLRNKIERDPGNPKYLQTVRRRGYKLISSSSGSGGASVKADNHTVGSDLKDPDKFVQPSSSKHRTAPIVDVQTPLLDESHPRTKSLTQSEIWLSNTDKLHVIGGIEFVRVPTGKFIMGSGDNNKLAVNDEKPQHVVEIPYDYWLARYPVTNAQFAKFIAKSGYKFDFDSASQQGPDHPAVYISWYDAAEYCKWLTSQLVNEIRLSNTHVRLPSEAEWEKAARGNEGNEWPWGNEFDQNVCNSRESNNADTTPVGKYSPSGDSPYGAADMVGNVWEWTTSLWGEDPNKPHYGYPYQTEDGRENLDASDKVYRILRGGAFTERWRNARAAFRSADGPRNRRLNVGFRIVIAPSLS
jgi:formylglycine-generating enzyme required for sulfatase activity